MRREEQHKAPEHKSRIMVDAMKQEYSDKRRENIEVQCLAGNKGLIYCVQKCPYHAVLCGNKECECNKNHLRCETFNRIELIEEREFQIMERIRMDIIKYRDENQLLNQRYTECRTERDEYIDEVNKLRLANNAKEEEFQRVTQRNEQLWLLLKDSRINNEEKNVRLNEKQREIYTIERAKQRQCQSLKQQYQKSLRQETDEREKMKRQYQLNLQQLKDQRERLKEQYQNIVAKLKTENEKLKQEYYSNLKDLKNQKENKNANKQLKVDDGDKTRQSSSHIRKYTIELAQQQQQQIATHFEDSMIINRKSEDQRKMISFLQELKLSKVSLIFQGTRDGMSMRQFHSKCDNKYNLLYLVENEFGFKYGAYCPCPISIDRLSEFETDESMSSFVFSLNLNKKAKVIEKEYTIWNGYKFQSQKILVSFGHGQCCNLVIAANSLTKAGFNWIQFHSPDVDSSYQTSANPPSDLECCGKQWNQKCKLREVEVYQIQ